jgi:hypothetical protein
MIRVDIRSDGWVEIQARKCLLVLTKAEFIRGLKRDNTWRRRWALEHRPLEAQERKSSSEREISWT